MKPREIKFRAWHKLTKVMIDWRMLMLLMDGKPIAITEGINQLRSRGSNLDESITHINGINIFSHKGFELMQFTGLHDKNGKEIYEGDIVKRSITNGYEKGEVKYSPAYFYINGSTRMDSTFEYEVIGNIYQNPELLK